MKHIAKFAPIITISWQINELEKILTGPGKLSGVSRNGPQAPCFLPPPTSSVKAFILRFKSCGFHKYPLFRNIYSRRMKMNGKKKQIRYISCIDIWANLNRCAAFEVGCKLGLLFIVILNPADSVCFATCQIPICWHRVPYPASRGFLSALCSGGLISNLCAKPSDFPLYMRNIHHTYQHFPFLFILYARSYVS